MTELRQQMDNAMLLRGFADRTRESYLYWVDNDIKKETMEAKREGKTFEEVDAVYDQYRYMDSIDSLDNKEGSGKLPSVPVIPENGAPLEPSKTEK